MHIGYQLLGSFMSVGTLNLSSILSTISCAPSFLAPGLRAVCLQTSQSAGLEDKRSTLPCLGPKPFYNDNQHSHSGAVMDSFWFTQSISPSCTTPQFQVHISEGNATIHMCHSSADTFNLASNVWWAEQGSGTAPKLHKYKIERLQTGLNKQGVHMNYVKRLIK